MDSRKVLAMLLLGALPSLLAGCRNHDSRDGNDGMSSATTTGSSSEVVVDKMGGEIDVADAPHGATLNTMGGEIHVGRVASFGKIKTMGGDIEVDHASGPLDVVTMGGEITIRSADGPVKAESMGGGITLREVGNSSGERDIQLKSEGGPIQLTVPKDFPMNVKITLAHTQNGHEYHIIQHAGLDVHETSDWDNSQGTPRKYIRANGLVGSGLNHITIETINGDVTLNQE